MTTRPVLLLALGISCFFTGFHIGAGNVASASVPALAVAALAVLIWLEARFASRHSP